MIIELSACAPNAQTADPSIDSTDDPVHSSPTLPPENEEELRSDSNEELVFLISGQINPRGTKLEPLLEIEGTPSLPINGPYKLQALGNNDEVLLEYPFSTAKLSHTNNEVEQFTFSISINKNLLEKIIAYRIVSIEKGEETELARIESALADISTPEIIPVSVERLRGDLVRFTWDSKSYPKVIIRDAPKGNILTIAEGGEVVVSTTTDTLSVTFSDGIYNETRDIKIPPR